MRWPGRDRLFMCVHECAEVSLGHPGTGSIYCVLASIISIGSPSPDVPRVRQGAGGREREHQQANCGADAQRPGRRTFGAKRDNMATNPCMFYLSQRCLNRGLKNSDGEERGAK